MSFPLWILLIPYVLFLFIAVIFLFLNLYHIGRFGLQALKTTLVLSLYIISFLVVLGVTSTMLVNFTWSDQVELQQILNLEDVFTIPGL